MREIKFRAWNGKQMDYDYRDASLWNGLLVAEGDTILMQCTGCTDLNGEEIYEGDIVYWEGAGRKFVQSVRWVEDRAMFLPNDMKGEVEIIGNIYENPELLKVNEPGERN